MVKAEKLSVFVNSVVAFFAQLGESLIDIDTPYLHDNATPIGYDYSGVIRITGPLQGSVYVSAPSAMLRALLTVMGESDSSLEIMKDLLGEIANTISGNARTEFGSDFIISPPQVMDGAPSQAYLPKERRSYIIPLHWRGYHAVIGICVA